uniref:Set2 Rpb1 interacting domain-containing protein n=1 Tax=Phlebotomus papatasi TaxID=29031 RepID=A0A1B0EZ59_PHLPP
MFPSNRKHNGYSNSCNSSQLELPDVFSSPRSDDELEVELDDPMDLLHLLSDNVRQEYLNYLEKLLHVNYETWMICNSPDDQQQLNLQDMHVCAKILEQKAVKSCMIVNLYRKAMLKIFCNAETQTEQENFLIERYFQESHAIPVKPPSPKKKRKNPSKKRRKSPKPKVQEEPPPPPAPVAEKDEIEANLEKLFASEHNELDIFDNAGEFDPHIKLVLSEAKDPPVKATEEIRSPKLPVSEENQKDSLRDSIWPCELRMRRKKLYEIMCSVGEFSLRRYEKVKVVFLELFGEDSDDEEAPISPSTDMDSVTLSSCRKRIAPTIVKHLMKPFNEGLIANRWLFKKLAKSLADSIVIENDYPDERYIKNFIEDYFAFHPKVVDVTDIV